MKEPGEIIAEVEGYESKPDPLPWFLLSAVMDVVNDDLTKYCSQREMCDRILEVIRVDEKGNFKSEDVRGAYLAKILTGEISINS